jgi:hypothetical protein
VIPGSRQDWQLTLCRSVGLMDSDRQPLYSNRRISPHRASRGFCRKNETPQTHRVMRRSSNSPPPKSVQVHRSFSFNAGKWHARGEPQHGWGKGLAGIFFSGP